MWKLRDAVSKATGLSRLRHFLRIGLLGRGILIQEQLIGEIFDMFDNGLTRIGIDFPFQLIVDQGIDLE